MKNYNKTIIVWQSKSHVFQLSVFIYVLVAELPEQVQLRSQQVLLRPWTVNTFIESHANVYSKFMLALKVKLVFSFWWQFTLQWTRDGWKAKLNSHLTAELYHISTMMRKLTMYTNAGFWSNTTIHLDIGGGWRGVPNPVKRLKMTQISIRVKLGKLGQTRTVG